MPWTSPVAAVALLLVLAGCSGTKHVEAAGSPAHVGADALSGTGYERVGATNRTLNATVSITVQGDVEGRESADVTATIPVVTYRRGADSTSVVAVASSPSVEVIENPSRSADPLATRSTAALAEFVQSTYANPTGLDATGTRTVTMLGEETTVRTYRGTAIRDGASVTVLVHVARVRHDGDVVTAVAVHPASASERGRVMDVFGSIRH